ncbi:MAG: hypothetical protein KC493_02960 [Bacteriovoracaceae bacterium]|nr:hypothetical protein [Bacteriovoracaceae bacterium]
MNPKPEAPSSLGVDAFKTDNRLVPDIKGKTEPINALGPIPTDNISGDKSKNKNKIPAVSLVLGPGLNRVRCYIPILKFLEKEEVKIHIISGSGMGAIMASMYALGITPDKMEWLFHKFSRKVRKLKPYRKEWLKLVDEIFLKKLKGKKIQNGNRRLILSLYNAEKGKLVYLSRGDLYWTLKHHMKLIPQGKKSIYMAPFHKEIYNQMEMKRLGADIVAGLDVLTHSVEFSRVDHFLLGTYGKASAIAKKELEALDIFENINKKSPDLDSFEGMPEYLQGCASFGVAFAKRLKSHILTWKKE